MTMTPLQLLHQRLEELSHKQKGIRYFIPRLWIPPHTQAGTLLLDNPAEYYHRLITTMLHQPSVQRSNIETNHQLAYLTYPRYTTAWDHDGSNVISYQPGRDGWRQTGTFLKMIALLPYLQWLGVTMIVLLPITSHGRFRAKGNLGSPYAPYDYTTIEETLCEPLLDLGAEHEFAAFVEACHRVGMHVVVEFALRVASLDSILIAQHPEWFYWVRADAEDPLRPPSFSREQIAAIEQARRQNNWTGLPAPDAAYRELFVNTPVHVERCSDGSYCGTTGDGVRCRVPSVFADYPPDDTQPLWTDVTYLRFHTHPAYNYIAYNTIRLYEEELRGWENKALWDYLSSIVPAYVERFDIDGVLFDMGHAFPQELHNRIIQRAKTAKPSLLLIEENFDISDTAALDLGYHAVVGDVWHHTQSISTLQRYSRRLQPKLQYFATPDTHNTPRIATRGWQTALYAFSICTQLPKGLPLITTGSELGEKNPINTGLDFSTEQLLCYPPERLPLFSGITLCWDKPDMRILRFIHALYGNHAS